MRSPERLLLDVSSVDHIHAQLIDGPIAILRGHVPLVGEMSAGALIYHTARGTEERLWLQPGVLRVERGQITVLTAGLLTDAASSPLRPRLS